MESISSLKVREGDLVLAYRDILQNKLNKNDRLKDNSDIMPYLIIGAKNGQYYGLLVTNNENESVNFYNLPKCSSTTNDTSGSVCLSAIYTLTQDDIIEVNNSYDNLNLGQILTKMAVSIINGDLFLSKKHFRIFKHIYKKYNNLNLGDIITIKKDNQIKNYIIFHKADEHTATGICCQIAPDKKVSLKDMQLDFTDCYKINEGSLLYYKLDQGLSAKELTSVLELKKQYFQNLKYNHNDAHYDMGVVVKINGYNYLVIADDDKNYYVTNYQERQLFNGFQFFAKDKFKFEYVGCIDNSELLKILTTITNDRSNNYPEVTDKVTKKVKQLLIIEKKN